MDEALFIFTLVVFFVVMAAIIYCILSTCLGLQIRRSDIWSALSSKPLDTDYRRTRHRFTALDSRPDGRWESDGLGAEAIEMMDRRTY